MKIIERILQLIDSEGINKNQFYIRTGISNGLLDKASKIGSDNIEKIYSSFPNTSLEWLITGSGSMYKTAIGTQVAEPTPTYKAPQILQPDAELISTQRELIAYQRKEIADLRNCFKEQQATNIAVGRILEQMKNDIAVLKNPNEAFDYLAFQEILKTAGLA